MTRSERLQRIVALADVSRQQASQALSQARRAHDANLEKLAQFRQYHAEYVKALAGGAAMNVASLREARKFIEQIERTIDVLDQQTRSSAERFRESTRHWQQERRRSEALGDVAASARARAAQDAESRQQREIDDRPRPPSHD